MRSIAVLRVRPDFFTDGGDEGVSGRFRLNRSVAM